MIRRPRHASRILLKSVIPIDDHCRQCLDHLIRTTAEATGAPIERQDKAVACARRILRALSHRSPSPAHLANRLHPVIKRICHSTDPFSNRKKIEAQAAHHLAQLLCPAQSDDFHRLMRFSAQGNAIDFFRSVDELESLLAEHPPAFGRDQLDEVIERLQAGSRLILWLADNTGEVFFDEPALRWLTRHGHRVIYAVKGAPVQNDLAASDLNELRVDLAPAEVMSTGAATVGIELDRVSTQFKQIFREADLIVAKGMGHFETLCGRLDPRVLFLFMAKCSPVAAIFGAPVDTLVAAFDDRL